MCRIKQFILTTTVALVPLTNIAFADAKATVQTFYDFLSNPSSTSHAEAFLNISAENWQSVGDYSGKTKSREDFTKQVGGFGKLVPDLNWEVKEMHQDGEMVIVRSQATGTPVGPLFGVDGEGRSFDIMAIDIHRLKGGKIVQSYHVEDWAGAMRQLSGKQ